MGATRRSSVEVSFAGPAEQAQSERWLADAHALVIGVSRYRHLPALPTTSDAHDVAAALVEPGLCGYPPAQVRTVLEEEATRGRLLDELARLARVTTPESSVFLYFSGHGAALPGREGFLLPVDTRVDSRDALVATALGTEELARALSQVRAARLTVVLDCCRASMLAPPELPFAPPADGVDGPGWSTGALAGALAALARGRGRAILAASSREGSSYVLPGQRNGVFTGLLLEGLRGAAPGVGGVIRVCDLYHYVQEQVVGRRLGQRPVFRAELEENYPLALYRGGRAPAWTLPPPPDRRRFDAFVSYCQKDPRDARWVERELVPTLENLGLRLCLERRDFRPGRHRLTELARAVSDSRYTVCVLSPSYLAGPFEAFTAELAQFHGVESQRAHLVPLLLAPCQPPLATRLLQLLDVSADAEPKTADPARLGATLARLALALREPAEL